jgi:exonuclease V gamma subunit
LGEAPTGALLIAQLRVARALCHGGLAEEALALVRDLPDPDRPTALTVDDLVRALLNPSEVFLRERLGIYLPDDDDPPPAREPLEVDTLDRYDVRTRLLKARGGGAADASAPDGAADAAVAEVLLRLRGEGKLPVAAGADSYVGKQDRMVEALLDAWTAESPVGERLQVGLSATIDGVTLSTQVDRLTRTEEGWTVELLGVSSPKGRRMQLRTWVTTLLAAQVAGDRQVRAIYRGLGYDGPEQLEIGPVTGAETGEELPGLLDVWKQARTRPIELFEDMSGALADAEAETEERSVARTAEVRAAAHRFHAEEDDFSRPDGTNRHVRALRPTYDAVGAVAAPDAEVLEFSRKVWGGFAQRERARKEAEKAAKEAEKAAKAAAEEAENARKAEEKAAKEAEKAAKAAAKEAEKAAKEAEKAAKAAVKKGGAK